MWHIRTRYCSAMGGIFNLYIEDLCVLLWAARLLPMMHLLLLLVHYRSLKKQPFSSGRGNPIFYCTWNIVFIIIPSSFCWICAVDWCGAKPCSATKICFLLYHMLVWSTVLRTAVFITVWTLHRCPQPQQVVPQTNKMKTGAQSVSRFICFKLHF